MKLIKLRLDVPFRSLPAGFSIDFYPEEQIADFAPFCLVGRNGTGKSNVLEVLAAIFYHLECMYIETPNKFFEADTSQPEAPYFDSAVSFPDAYELVYRIHVEFSFLVTMGSQLLVRIVKTAGNRPEIASRPFDDPDAEFQVADRTMARRVLPDLVIGYSSGENEILSLPFFKMRFINFDEYVYRTENLLEYQQPEGRMFYFDGELSQAVVLVNFLMQKKGLLAPFKKEMDIEAIESFRLVIRRQPAVQVPSYRREDQADAQGVLHPDVERMIENLKKCATTWHETQIGWPLVTEQAATPVLILDYWVNEETCKAFGFYFEGNPLLLMRTFQILFALNMYGIEDNDKRAIYYSSDLYTSEAVPKLAGRQKVASIEQLLIRKKGIAEPIFLKSLSDGEHQFLHAIGISILSRSDNVLLLLDEPETHFNPAWRAKFISTLRDCLVQPGEDESGIESEFLITSHSPFVVSDCKPGHVFLFRKNEETNVVEARSAAQLGFNNFGASVEIILATLFDYDQSIGDLSNAFLTEIDFDKVKTPADVEEIKRQIRHLGDSIEKDLVLARLNQILKQG